MPIKCILQLRSKAYQFIFLLPILQLIYFSLLLVSSFVNFVAKSKILKLFTYLYDNYCYSIILLTYHFKKSSNINIHYYQKMYVSDITNYYSK